MAGLGSIAYKLIGRRFSTLFLTAVVGAYTFNLGFNAATDGLWDYINQGKQWKDIKDKIALEASAE